MIPTRHVCLLVLLTAVIQTAPAHSAEPPQFALDCTFRNSDGVLLPGQSIILDVILRPTTPNSNPTDTLDFQAALFDLSSPGSPPIGVFGTKLPPNTPLPISFVTPEKEGVYEIKINVTQTIRQHPFPNVPVPRLTAPVYVAQTIAEVQRQFVVISPQPTPRSTGTWTLTDPRDLLAMEDDSPARRQLLNIPRVSDLPRLGDLPRIADLPRPAELLRVPTLGRRNSTAQSGEIDGELSDEQTWCWWEDKRYIILPAIQGQILEKSENNPHFSALAAAQSDGYTWHSLPIEALGGQPYLIEIDYPSNIPQTLGVAVVDYLLPWGQQLNKIAQINTAVTIHVAEEIVRDLLGETTATHQILFWATTNQPELLLINSQPNQEALFRNIRISKITLPHQDDLRLPKLFEGEAQRKRIGQILGNNSFTHLAGTPAPDTPGYRLNDVTDWHTAYETSSRLIDKLHRGGYDGVTLTVLSKHLSLYPTTAQTPNYLEMLFRQFNSEGLTLIPAIEFNLPIPSLESLLQQHPGIIEEILIGNPDERHYNLLHPAVQQAMSGIVLDLVNRFGQHPSFGGVAVVLSPETYAQLPFALYPPDDYTFAQFRQETEKEIGVPFPDEQRMRQTMPTQQFLAQKNVERIQFLQNNPTVRETWTRWRAAKISGFYADLAKQVAAKRDNAPLYLLGGTMLDHPEIQSYCAPTLPRNFAALQAVQLLGFDLQLLSKAEPLHFSKPVQIAPVQNYAYDDLNSTDLAALFSKSVQFVHQHSGGTAAGSVGSVAGSLGGSRKRFAQQLAQSDVMMFIDGGTFLPLGQEPAMFDLLDTYRRLPTVPFRTLSTGGLTPPAHENSLQPLTVRYANLPDGMMMYIVNDASFSVEADFFFTADLSSRMTELTGHRMIRTFNRHLAGTPAQTHTWRASLAPYDLLAVRISDANAKIESVSVHRPSSIYGAEGALKQKVEELNQRVHTARSGVLWDGLVNADFELPLDAAGGLVGWQCFGQSLTANLDQTAVYKGENSVRLTNSSTEPGTFLSLPMNIPPTGRLGVSMFVGIPAESSSLPMSVVLTARHQDRPLYRNVPVGETLLPALANTAPKNGVRWHRLVVPFERLPTESLEDVRIGVQYSGGGTVWIDDVMLYQALFSSNELVELQKMLVVANQRHSSERVSDLMSLLEGHWTQFLFRHVPAVEPVPRVADSRPPVAREVSPPPKSPTLYQRVRGFFGK